MSSNRCAFSDAATLPRAPNTVITLALSIVFTLVAASAYAGTITVKDMKHGSKAEIWLKDKDGNLLARDEAFDTNNDGQVQFGVKDQEKVKKIVVIKVTPDGKPIEYDGRFDGSTSMLNLEPFDLPTFAALTPTISLFSIIDVAGFLSGENPFVLGQILGASDGRVSSSAHVLFKDATGITDFDLLADSNFAAGLPNFTGSLEVRDSDLFRPVPEPGSIVLLLSGLAAGRLAARRRARRGSTTPLA